MSLRILVDFNTMMQDPEERVRINLSVDANSHAARVLHPGAVVILYEPDDLEVEAIVEYDDKHKAWLAKPNWPTRRDLSPS